MKPKNMRFHKFFITLFNTCLIIYALSIIGYSVLEMRDIKAHPDQPGMLSRGLISFFVTLALFVAVTAVLGIVGALRMHIKTLYVQSCFYIFLVSVEVIVAIGAALLTTWLVGKSDMRVSFYKNSTIEDDMVKQQNFWDNLQYTHNCCGVDGPQDYAIINRDVPASCCERAHPLREGGARRHLHATCLAEKTYYTRGCEEALTKIKDSRRNMSIAFVVTGIFSEVTVIIISLFMARNIRRERRKLQQNLQAHFES